ncbi:MAG TPA: alanine--glyoxylate aminotransferase family protein [Stellaceae bacterium]|nr:alanine--glyoxylate aminotransferase family protein [Stellaceae bacterium]
MTSETAADMFGEIDPRPCLLMGPGPINAYPRVLRAMAAPLLGQFDPQFTAYMNQTMALYRQVFETENHWTFLIDGTARAAIEAVLVSAIEPGDRVLVPVFGRFGHLKVEIATRIGADVRVIEAEWGTVFRPEQIEAALLEHRPKLVAICQGDTSTTMAQPLDEIGALCRRHGVLTYVDATASLGGMPLPVDRWQLDAVTAGLQKCLGGPSGSAPITLGPRMVEVIERRRHIERGLRPADGSGGGSNGRIIGSNYFDLAMLMDYWGERRLNHHTEASSMLYAARECARIILGEGLVACHERHAAAGGAMVAGLVAMGLELFGDQRHKMPNVTGILIPPGIDGERVRGRMLADFSIEIGSSFGPLHGRIWRIGTMGYNCRKDAVLTTLAALETVLAAEGFKVPRGAAADAALAHYGTGTA